MTTTSSSFDRGLQALADDERRSNAARQRLHRADRRTVDGLSGTFLGTLIELSETGAPVTFLTRTGASIRGTITVIATDSIVIRTNKSGLDVLLRIAAVEGLLEDGAGHDRTVTELPTNTNFVGLLDRYSERNERIAVTTSSGNKSMGRIQRVGEDQLLLELDGQGTTMTVPISIIDQVVTAR